MNIVKEILQFILCVAIIFGILYIPGAFMGLELNPTKWPLEGRVFISLVSFIAGFVIFVNIDDIIKNQKNKL